MSTFTLTITNLMKKVALSLLFLLPLISFAQAEVLNTKTETLSSNAYQETPLESENIIYLGEALFNTTTGKIITPKEKSIIVADRNLKSRFFAVDPLSQEYPFYTPYSFSGNKVIHAVELEGLEELIFHKNFHQQSTLQDVYTSNDHLDRIISSISKEDKARTQKIHFISADFSSGAFKHAGGATLNLLDEVKWQKGYLKWANENTDATINFYKKEKARSNDLNRFLSNSGLNAEQVLKDGKNGIVHYLVGVNEAFSINAGTSDKNLTVLAKIFFHEVEAHLKDQLEGDLLKPQKDHEKFGNTTMNKKSDGSFTFPTTEDSPAETTFNAIDETVENGCKKENCN